jgi:2-polyprenyl-3-methyl-5-hydroxy-6-metoxy-1,4-benzoquinol methylase
VTDFFKSLGRKMINSMPAQLICRLEFKRQSFVGFNERPVEFGFVFRRLHELYPEKVLDVGTGTTALPHLMRNCGCLVTATDNIKDFWPSGMSNRHYHVVDDDITASRMKEKFDLITCISVLEHIESHDAAIRNMFNLLNPKGHLILTFPYSENQYVRNVYEIAGSNAFGKSLPYICQSYSRKELSQWLQQNGGEVIEQEYWQFWDGDYWSIGSQILPPVRARAEEKHQLACLLIQKTSR